ncbi:MAG: phosphatase [Lachnospiraceae bacterium]|nr:phosphatase [Lachnospiraceae bacterium]
MKILVDTHAHTLVSGHAYSTIKEMSLSAAQKGMEGLALTEHAPQMPGSCGLFYFQNLKVVPKVMNGIQMLLGVELNIMDNKGTIDLEPLLIKNLDIAIASIHTPCYGESRGIEENTNAYINAMKQPYINIIGHPDDGRYPIDYERLVLAAKEHQVLLEVNNSSLRANGFRVNAQENVSTLLELCKKHNVYITVGSDAHVDVDAGCFDDALAKLESCDFPEELVVNTSFEKLKPFINRYKNL